MGSDKNKEPVAPTAPTVQSSMSDYISSYPKLFELMQTYAPQEAQLQLDLASKYSQPMAEAYKTAQEALYPQETQISRNLNNQVLEGMSGQVPDWMKTQYQSNMNAQLGQNAGSPIGADYISTSMLGLQNDYNKYYQNLGLSITGKQPIYSATQPNYTNQLQSYTPSSVMNLNSSTYGTQANMYNNQMNSYNQTGSLGSGIGSLLGAGIGGAAAMMMPGSQAYLMPLGSSLGGQFGSMF